MRLFNTNFEFSINIRLARIQQEEVLERQCPDVSEETIQANQSESRSDTIQPDLDDEKPEEHSSTITSIDNEDSLDGNLDHSNIERPLVK